MAVVCPDGKDESTKGLGQVFTSGRAWYGRSRLNFRFTIATGMWLMMTAVRHCQPVILHGEGARSAYRRAVASVKVAPPICVIVLNQL
ncbi:hypothetical protein D3C77_723330 [compost metagenome]